MGGRNSKSSAYVEEKIANLLAAEEPVEAPVDVKLSQSDLKPLDYGTSYSFSVQGIRPSNEDTHAIHDRLPMCQDFSCWAVYDGHNGTAASNYCAEKLHLLIDQELSKFKGDDFTRTLTQVEVHYALIKSFCAIDDDFLNSRQDSGSSSLSFSMFEVWPLSYTMSCSPTSFLIFTRYFCVFRKYCCSLLIESYQSNLDYSQHWWFSLYLESHERPYRNLQSGSQTNWPNRGRSYSTCKTHNRWRRPIGWNHCLQSSHWGCFHQDKR